MVKKTVKAKKAVAQNEIKKPDESAIKPVMKGSAAMPR
jgi:hypothetical protein